MNDLSLTDFFPSLTVFIYALGNSLILPLSLFVGVFAIVARCEWSNGFRIVTQIAGVLLISSSVLSRSDLIMFMLVMDFLAWLVLFAQFLAAAFVALALIFGKTRWPTATKLFFRPLSMLLALLVGFQFAGHVVAVFFN